MYTTILWYLDNTLLDFNASEKYAFNTCMVQAGLTPNDTLLSLYSQINRAFWNRLERGEITKKELLTQRFVHFFATAGISGVDIALFRDTYQRLLGSVFYCLDDSLTLCRKLHASHRQYIVTNGVASTQRNKLQGSGLADLMDGCFISEELGFEKPSAEFFRLCMERIPAFQKQETLIVGDSLTSDMLGGVRAGIACCWYNPGGAPAPDDLPINHTIRSLWELLPLLGL